MGLQRRPMSLDLAQTFYDLRVETLRNPEDPGAQTAVRTLLDAMGASDWGSYELQYYDLSEEPQFLTAMHTGAYWPALPRKPDPTSRQKKRSCKRGRRLWRECLRSRRSS